MLNLIGREIPAEGYPWPLYVTTARTQEERDAALPPDIPRGLIYADAELKHLRGIPPSAYNWRAMRLLVIVKKIFDGRIVRSWPMPPPIIDRNARKAYSVGPWGPRELGADG